MPPTKKFYTYKDFLTGKLRRTYGKFVKWSDPTGPLDARYAIFRTPKTFVYVPEYELTTESREALPPMLLNETDVATQDATQ